MVVSILDHLGQPFRESAFVPATDWRDAEIELLRESILELEMGYAESGWTRLNPDTSMEFSREGLREITRLARLMYLKNPLINRAVEVQKFYVWALGWSVKAADPLVNEVIQEFLDDDKNRAELTSQQAAEGKEVELQTSGNLFFVFFPNESTGLVRVRSIEPNEIEDIICNPEDAREPWFYKRVWKEARFDAGAGTGLAPVQQRTAYYPDWRYRPEQAVSKIGDYEVMTKNPVYHVRVGGLPGMKFGMSEIYSALDWARAAKEHLEDWAAVWRALSQFAFQLKTQRGTRAVAAAKTRLGTTVGNAGNGVLDLNPPALPGSTFIQSEGVELMPMRASGATVDPNDSRRLWLMVASGTGIPECYSEDTEVLTEHGFVRHDEWERGSRVACFNPDSGQVEWHEPNDLRAYYYNGDMIHFKNGQTDILVTPNHRMWTAPALRTGLPARELVGSRVGRPRVSEGGAGNVVDRSWRIETAEHLYENPRTDGGWKFTSALRWEEPETEGEINTPWGLVDAVAWARFIGYWISEGCATQSTCKSGEYRKDGTPRMRTFRRVTLAQKPGPILDSMRATLRSLGRTHWTESIATAGVVNITLYGRELFDWLRSNCGQDSGTKRIPNDLLYGGAAVRHALYTALMEGDGGRAGSSWRYSTKSRELADQMQILANSLGYGSSVTLENQPYRGHLHPIYRVWIRTNITATSNLKPAHVSRVPYTGMVYCFNVPHGIYVTRRNGKVAIQGNTFFGDANVGNHATAKTMDRPTELRMTERQTLWTDVYGAIFDYVLRWAVRAPDGLLAGRAQLVTNRNGDGEIIEWGLDDTGQEINPQVEIRFPDLLEHDIEARIRSIVDAATLGGHPSAGTIMPKRLTELVLTALGIDDIDEEIAEMFPDDPQAGDILPSAPSSQGGELRTEPGPVATGMAQAARVAEALRGWSESQVSELLHLMYDRTLREADAPPDTGPQRRDTALAPLAGSLASDIGGQPTAGRKTRQTMLQAYRQAYESGLLHGNPDHTWGAADDVYVQNAVKNQMDYLRGFARDVRKGVLSDAQASARADLYGAPLSGAYSRGFVTGGQEKGVTGYTWQTSADDACCENCLSRDGVDYSVDELPGYPGEGDFGSELCLGGPACRCWLEPNEATE